MKKESTPETDVINTAIELAINWLLYNQSQSEDAGFATYDFSKGWTSSYPETSGYIAESFLMWKALSAQERISNSARRTLDWLVSIQKPSGGWAGGYLAEGRPEIVFNTGQILRGMIQGFLHFKEQKYLSAAQNAADWLVEIQNPAGYWDRYVYMNAIRVYDTYVSAPLYTLGQVTGKPIYIRAALKNAHWVAGQQLQPNGWYKNADNSLKYNDKPILHTIAYTLDGLLDIAIQSKDKTLLESALSTAHALAGKLRNEGLLRGRYSNDWTGHGSICNTGVAQTAIIFCKLYIHTCELEWKILYFRLINYLLSQQIRTYRDPNMCGALTGSSPIWGRYEPFRLPNWGVKYLIDALMYYHLIIDNDA
ncbi:MAG: hypothetical protein ACK4KT_07765 [Thermaurantimonas sp.]